jgi:hypothetical protein
MHDKYAPYWAITLVILLGTGLSTIWFDFGDFWSGYVLDMVGPAWTYVLFRGLFTAIADNIWTRFFSPNRTLIILLICCFGIETLQYFKIYDSTFDYWDLLAYISILVPLYLIDRRIIRKTNDTIHNKKYNALSKRRQMHSSQAGNTILNK